MADYFDTKAAAALLALSAEPDDVAARDTLARAFKEVARDQRHACAEAVNDAADDLGGEPSHVPGAYHAAAMNARPEPSPSTP